MRRSFWIVTAIVSTSGGVAAQDWPHYGGDEGGQRHTAAALINKGNVDNLVRAWTFSTDDLTRRPAEAIARSNFQGTPILFAGHLVMCTGFNEVIALDPGTGSVRWRFDPQAPLDRHYGNGYTCRGVTGWKDSSAAPNSACAERIYMGTNDSRLIALDVRSGQPCESFGDRGVVTIDPGMSLVWSGEFQITSPPVIVGDVIVIGSSISDNARAVAPRGSVRAFNVRAGTPRWSWDPVPRDPNDPSTQTWGEAWKDVGHANVWAPMSVDSARGLIFLPTSSASPDFFGGLRPGANRHANSVVALKRRDRRSRVGLPTRAPRCMGLRHARAAHLGDAASSNGSPRDVVIQGTKQGFVFVLDRDTGEPIFPVEERTVPTERC